jgi:hypothetical protein
LNVADRGMERGLQCRKSDINNGSVNECHA